MTWTHARELAWRLSVFGMAVAILTVVATRWSRWEGRSGWQTTDDAYLQADITPISSKVAGYVRLVPGQDFEPVRAGQLVATLVDDDYRAMVAQAEAASRRRGLELKGCPRKRFCSAPMFRRRGRWSRAPPRASKQNTRDLARQQRLLTSESLH